MIRTPSLIALIALAGCATSRSQPTAPTSIHEGQCEERLDRLENRVGHLESELVASRPEGEFKEMTIDWVQWGDDSPYWRPSVSGSQSPTLLCHVVEWNGFGRMLRFTRLADEVFYLETPGRPAVEAFMCEGGVCDGSGETRFVILSPQGPLEPGVEYTLRPQNDAPDYSWLVADGLRVSMN